MGWSCRADAAETMDKWTAACIAQTGMQNVFEAGGKRFFWETSRREHADGAITGTVFEELSDGRCRGVGNFRINPDGDIGRAPAFLKAAAQQEGT